MINYNELSRDEINDLICDNDMSLNELFLVKERLQYLNNNDSLIETIDEMIEDYYLDLSLNELIKLTELVNTKNLGINLLERHIIRKSKITVENYKLLNEEDIEYLIFDGDLDLEQLLILEKAAKEKNVPKDDIQYLKEQIKESIELIETDKELQNAIDIIKKLQISTTRLNKLIRKINPDILETESEEESKMDFKTNNNSLFGEILISNLTNHLFDLQKNREIDVYNDYNYEEKEVEEDDYFFDDLD